MEALGINLGYLLVQIFMFGIVFITLKEWVYKPVLALLDRRRKAIAQGVEDARIAAEARANAERDASQIMNEAQAKAAQIVREATERAESAAREVRTQAEAEMARSRDVALADVETERSRILGDLRSQVAALAIAAAQRIIGFSLDERRQHELLDELFSGVKNGRVTVLEGMTLDGETAEVTSALPLTSNEQETIKRDLLQAAGPGTTISFRVDPNILGGLVVRVGDKLMDGSVANQLQDLRTSLS